MMTATMTLMTNEFRMLGRNTTAWSTAIALPVLLAGFMALGEPSLGDGIGALMALQVLVMLVFTLHTVGTMTLAARRQHLVLKRWRSSQASDVAILLGTIAPVVVMTVLQIALLTLFTAVIHDAAPAVPVLLVAGVGSACALVAALTFVVAGFTRGPEHAMITTVPVSAALLAGALPVLSRPLDQLPAAVLAIPGAAPTQLILLGWQGTESQGAAGTMVQALPGLAAGAVLTAVAVAMAARFFRWEPRS